MIARLAVIVEPRPRRWVFEMLDALNRCGIEAWTTEHPPSGVRALDLRAAASRARAPMAAGWHLEIGTERGGIPAFEEAALGEESVCVSLVVHERRGAFRVRYGLFPYASRYSRTLQRIVRQCAQWIKEELLESAPADACEPWTPRLPKAPARPLERAMFFLHEGVRIVRHVFRYAFEESRWDVAVTSGAIDEFLRDPHAAWLHWVARDDREFLADPFVLRSDDGSTRLLCETFDGTTTSIVSINLDDRFGPRVPVFSNAGPMSYPFVFEVGEQTWLAPEQHASRAVSAYHLNGKVEPLEAPLHEGLAAVDPTIVAHDGRWWLFCTDQDDAPNYALRIFWALDPRGPWHPHARNPAKIDIGGARPAGNFFTRDGTLYRPAQDCRGRYGRAIVVQRIDVLTPERFEETTVARVEAHMLRRKGAIGVHTLSHGHGWIALDAQFTRWSVRKPLRLLRGGNA